MKKLYIVCFILLMTIMVGTQAWATALSFDPLVSLINIGDMLEVNISISDLSGSYIGAFDFNVNFDDTILTFDSYILSDNLGDISLGDADDWSLGDLGFGTVNIAELSWLWDLSFQEDSFTLATLFFTGNSAGNSELEFGFANISDDWGDPIVVSLGMGTIDVAAPIPEPGTIFLLGIGLAGLAGTKFRRKKKVN